MPEIAHIAALWSLFRHPSAKAEWSMDRKIRGIAEAGFDGLTGRLTPEIRALAETHGLRHLLGFIASSDPNEFPALIREQKEGGAVHINVQMDDHDTAPAVATKHWIALEKVAERLGGVVVSLEVHRDTCTETPEKTYEIADRYHRATGRILKVNFDFSHFAVVKHLSPDVYAERLLDHPELVRNSEQCHCRPFNGHHCQVPVTHRGALTPEVKAYLSFVESLMRLWRTGPGNRRRTLYVCPEMGPYATRYAKPGGGYNITGLPPSWPEAVILRQELGRTWRKSAS